MRRLPTSRPSCSRKALLLANVVSLILASSSLATGQCILAPREALTVADSVRGGFGYSVAVSGDTAVVGAPWDSHAGIDSGAAYVLREIDGSWTHSQRIVASDAARYERFGNAVAIDGDVLIIGTGTIYTTDQPGAAYIFRLRDGVWVEEQILSRDDVVLDTYGISVAVRGDVAVVGAPWNQWPPIDPTVYVYRDHDGTWIEEARLIADEGESLGYSLAISGDRIVSGAVFSKAAYVFKHDGGGWVREQKLVGNDAPMGEFGFDVAIDGDSILVGCAGNFGVGALYFFTRGEEGWLQQQKIEEPWPILGYFGSRVALSGRLALAGSANRYDCWGGEAWSYRFDGNQWVRSSDLADTGPGAYCFGISLAVRGDTAFVGAPLASRDGLVDVFEVESRVCWAGTVAIDSVGIPAPVLTVNGDAAACGDHTVKVRTNEPLEVFVDTPPGGPNPASFVLYAWLDRPGKNAEIPQPKRLGTTCFSTFLTTGIPKPDFVWNNVGREPLLGPPDRSSEPAPSTVLSLREGVGHELTMTLQGIIQDRESRADVRASVTNAIVVDVAR